MDNSQRRQQLIVQMKGLNSTQIDCSKCSGVCCTFVANSMQITPVEALDLYRFLQAQNRFSRSDLIANAERFGLNRPEVGDGRRGFSRRRYTCPFKSDGALGCTIPPKHKPYGCLGFNPAQTNALDGEGCTSDQSILAERESSEEDQLNAELSKVLNLDWAKKEIPVALLDLDLVLQDVDLSKYSAWLSRQD